MWDCVLGLCLKHTVEVVGKLSPKHFFECHEVMTEIITSSSTEFCFDHMAGTKIFIPEISVQYAGLPLRKVAYSLCDMPSGVSEICGETCRAGGTFL